MYQEDTPMVNKCEKMVNIISREISFAPTMVARTKKISVGSDVEKLEPSYIAGGNAKGYCHFEKLFGNSSESYRTQQSLFQIYIPEK